MTLNATRTSISAITGPPHMNYWDDLYYYTPCLWLLLEQRFGVRGVWWVDVRGHRGTIIVWTWGWSTCYVVDWTWAFLCFCMPFALRARLFVYYEWLFLWTIRYMRDLFTYLCWRLHKRDFLVTWMFDIGTFVLQQRDQVTQLMTLWYSNCMSWSWTRLSISAFAPSYYCISSDAVK